MGKTSKLSSQTRRKTTFKQIISDKERVKLTYYVREKERERASEEVQMKV